MVRILIIIISLFMGSIFCIAENSPLQGGAVFNWDAISQEERENNIGYIKENIFGKNYKQEKNKNFKLIYKDYLKDKDYEKHYMAATAGYKEYKQFNISAMYLKKLNSLYIYALQPKNNPSVIYYYDALGNLRYIDIIKGLYPDFPYYTEQYRRNGSLAGVSYFTSRDTQYIFKSNGDFKGVWNKYNFYNLKGKVIMHRSNY